jgi:23S rRNA (pseudouridine1915-N3)-methyltransferase
MQLLIAAVGRARSAPEDAITADYLERARALGKRLGFTKIELAIVETSRAANVNARMVEEATRLTAKIPKGAHSIALDELGRVMTSEAFARHLAKLRDDGAGELVFLIGGPDGLLPTLRDGTKERLAFGAQTWPHSLVRAMLAEQFYRACAILAGHPYHRGA